MSLLNWNARIQIGIILRKTNVCTIFIIQNKIGPASRVYLLWTNITFATVATDYIFDHMQSLHTTSNIRIEFSHALVMYAVYVYISPSNGYDSLLHTHVLNALHNETSWRFTVTANQCVHAITWIVISVIFCIYIHWIWSIRVRTVRAMGRKNVPKHEAMVLYHHICAQTHGILCVCINIHRNCITHWTEYHTRTPVPIGILEK